MLLQVLREFLDPHPVDSRAPFIGLDSLQCLLAVFQLADFFHQSFGSSPAFSLTLRHQRFGPSLRGFRSITPTFHWKGQHLLYGPVFLPLSAHEAPLTCLLLYSPCGEPFGPSITVPGLAYLFLRLSAYGVPQYPRRLRDLICPLLTSTTRSGGIASSSVTFCDVPQISRGKFDRLRCTAAGFTTSGLDGYGLRRHLPLRPPP